MPTYMMLHKTERMYDIGKRIEKVTPEGRGRRGTSVVDGLTLADPTTKIGLVQLTVGQMLNLWIEPVRYDPIEEKIIGYQRGFNVPHARRFARNMMNGDRFTEPHLGLDNGKLYIVNGKHTTLAAIMAGVPLEFITRTMTYEERARQYAAQGKALGLSGDNIVLTLDDPIADYIRAAIVAKETGATHAWAGLIGEKTNASYISPNLAYMIIASYSFNRMVAEGSRSKGDTPETLKKFRPHTADELATLLRAFGTKRTNPHAFEPPALRALTDLATAIKRSNMDDKAARARWAKHMARFPWEKFPQISHANRWREELVKQWNKKLTTTNKISFD